MNDVIILLTFAIVLTAVRAIINDIKKMTALYCEYRAVY